MPVSWCAGASTLTAEDMYNIALESQRTVSIGTLGKLRHSVFLVKESRTDNKGIGVGVFIGPNQAVTADHILLDDQTRVYAAMPEVSKVLICRSSSASSSWTSQYCPARINTNIWSRTRVILPP